MSEPQHRMRDGLAGEQRHSRALSVPLKARPRRRRRAPIVAAGAVSLGALTAAAVLGLAGPDQAAANSASPRATAVHACRAVRGEILQLGGAGSRSVTQSLVPGPPGGYRVHGLPERAAGPALVEALDAHGAVLDRARIS